jgi:hypothetical protein
LQLPAPPVSSLLFVGKSLALPIILPAYDYTHIDQGFLQLPAPTSPLFVTKLSALPILPPTPPSIYDYTHIDQAFLQLPIPPTPLNIFVNAVPTRRPEYRDYSFTDRGAIRFPFVPPLLPKNQYQWPVPIAPPRLDQTYTAAYLKTLIGQDKLPVRQQYWPLTPAPAQPAQTWLSQSLISLRTAPVPQVPNNQYDWPVPKPIDTLLRTHTNPGITVPPIKLPPGAQQYDRTRPLDAPTWLANWINSVNQVLLLLPPPSLPFNQYDWPVPKGAEYPNSLRTYFHRMRIYLLGQDLLPFRQHEWPPPTPPQLVTTSAHTWISSVNILLLKPPVIPYGVVARGSQVLPPAQLWPDRYPIDLRSIAFGRALYGTGLPPIIPPKPTPLGPVDHIRPYADQYYGVMYAEEVTRGEPHFAQRKGTDFKKAGN